ncbi:MAG TPA: multicopper oxidase domain-containing protein [Actinomycetota bacterium]|nr:multicopper oxidase domain-containing protein [Actinomycetota bacterium]
MNRFHRIAAVAVVIVALVAASCGGGDGSTNGSGGAGDRAGGKTTFDVNLTEFAIAPAMIDVPSGTPLTFKVSNDGTTVHTFSVHTEAKVYETDQIQPGSSVTLLVDALDPGTYKTSCTIPGHEDLGMVGQLMVGGSMGRAAMASGGAAPSMQASMGAMTADQMAQSHKASVEAFPAKTEGTGNVPLKPTIQNGVKVFELTATEVKWETSPGTFVDGMAFNGQIPGPEIRVQQGDRVRIVVNDQMSQPTVVHFHGMTVPNKADGVPYITQDPIMPGGYYVYEFTVKDPPGIYVYHSHFNSTEQVGKGLYGALIVEPKGGAWSYPEVRVDRETGQITSYGAPPKIDVETTLFLGDGPLGYVLNGKEFPATSPIVAKTGDWVLIHMANDGSMLHPMHLHGYHFEVVAQDGFPLKDPYMADTLVVAPGQRFDVLVRAVYPGVWPFHCHILPHVEGPEGMYGMVTALVVR